MKFAMLSSDTKAYTDAAGKIGIILFFSLGAKEKIVSIVSLSQSTALMEPATRWIHMAADVSALAFIMLVIVTTLFRHRPLQAASGFEPWLSAMAGTFLAGTLALLPRTENPLQLMLVAVAMSAVGAVLSAYVLLWLGRSFSISAQARKLVTSGPYALVRHPLYLAEELMVLGILILVISPLAIAIAAVHWGFQLRRMINEEKVLAAAYPDYAIYAAGTPRIIPRVTALDQAPA